MNTPFHTVLIMAVTELVIVPDADRFMPPAKLGNLKDPDKIRDKEQEHEIRWRESLVGDPLLSTPTRVEWFTLADMQDTQGVGTVAEFIQACDEAFATAKPQAILGPHPTTHMRLVQNAVLRASLGLRETAVFTRVLSPGRVPRINIWHDVCPDSRAGCAGCREVLEAEPDGSSEVDATVDLAKVLGYLD